MQESENDDEVEPTPSRSRFNAFVYFFRSREAIRMEVVMAAKNYMTQRMNIEQEEHLLCFLHYFAFCKNYERFCFSRIDNCENVISRRS